MTGSFNLWLVALSYGVAVLASYLALQLAAGLQESRAADAYSWELGLAAAAMGAGIWSMHFVGMLAFQLAIPVPYDPRTTFLSLVCAVLTSYVALRSIGRATLDARALVLSGTSMGGGISLMHYVGMRALQVAPRPDYDVVLVAASIGIAILASMAAICICFRLKGGATFAQKLTGALVMGAAIAAMHYTGMAATTFAPGTYCTGDATTLSRNWLAGLLALLTLLMLVSAPMVTGRLRWRWRPRDVSIRRWSGISYVVNGVLLALLAVLATQLFLIKDDPVETASEQYRTMLVLDELAHQTEASIREARSFVVTGDARYASRYRQVAQIAGALRDKAARLNLARSEQVLLRGAISDVDLLQATASRVVAGRSDNHRNNVRTSSQDALLHLSGTEVGSSQNHLEETLVRLRTAFEARMSSAAAKDARTFDALLTGVLVLLFALLVSLGSTYLFTRDRVSSLLSLDEATRRVGEAGYIFAPHVDADDEIGHLASTFSTMLDKITQRTRALEHEIEERRSTERLLSENEERFRSVVEASPYGIAMVEDTGVIGMVNAEAEAMFGRPREQLIGQPVELLLPQKMHEAHRRERVGYEAHPTARTMGTGRDLSARRADGSEFPIEIGLSPIRIGGRKMVLCSMVDITVRKRAEQALRESESQLESIIENLSEGVLVCDLEGRLRKCNQTTAAIHGFDSPAALLAQISTAPDVIEFSGMDGQPWSTADFPLARLIRNEAVRHLECRVRRKGRPEWMRVLSWNGTLVPDQQGGSSLAVLTVSDITDRAQAEAERQQSQKLESVGRLAAGVAHEINSPVQYVSDCCHFLRDGVREVSALLLDYQGALESIEQSSRTPQMARDALAKRCEEADLPYLLENMPGAADRAIEGLQRVATIVRSMKEFAHPDQKEKTYADLNQAIASTLTIARNEYKYVADVQTEFGDLPLVPCHLGDFNQAVLNIVINAAHAVESVIAAQGGRGRITVRTRRERGEAVIEIEDTGCGIPEAIRDRIFDPFFTTKPVGKGTGQGLAIARSVIVDRHQGMLSVSSKEGAGTTFTIRLPLDRDGSGLALAA